MSLQGSQMENDDPTTSYMLQVCIYTERKYAGYLYSHFNAQALSRVNCLIYCRHGPDSANVWDRISSRI